MSYTCINHATNSHNITRYSQNSHSFNNTHPVNNDTVPNVNNTGAADERAEILTWLSPIQPRIRHQNIRTSRADNVGERLLETDEFQRWYKGAQGNGSDNAALFCYGDPAVGKTYFSSLVVDRLCDKVKDQNIAIAYFYVDFAAREEQPPINMLCSLLEEIVGGLERIPEEMRRTFQEHKKVIGGRGPRISEIVKMLQAATSSQPTFICIDALDECAEEHRLGVLASLGKILDKSPNTRIFLTGRPHIRSEIEGYLGGGAATLAMKLNNGDIVGYIRMRFSKDTSRGAMDSGLEDEIIKTIAENIPETFLTISLTMDAILGETTVYGRRQRLREVSGGLDLKGAYDSTLERIKEQGGERARLGMAALMWISHSERLLKLDELFHALAVEMGSRDLNPERAPSVDTLLGSCLGLVVIDKEASTVRLIHVTLQEYLHTRPGLFGATHAIIAETCLTYLNFRTIKEVSPTRFTLPQSTAFLNYSSLYWGVHARRDASKEVISLALKLFGQIESHISTKLLLADVISRTGRYNSDIPTSDHLIGFTGLHCASVFGIADIATALIGQPNCDLNKRDFLGITPLIWAAICGQEQVAELLLEQWTIIPDKPDKYFRRTALSWAASKGHEGIVKLFLALEPAKPSETGGWWSEGPRVINRVINLILGRRYINPNRPDKYGERPILLAAEEGYEGVVKLLLGRKDLKPDATDGYGHTALSRACGKGQAGVVKLLVERKDVKIDRPNKNGQTLLISVVENGHEGLVALLLGRADINSNGHGNGSQTLLSWAAQKGHDAAVKLLLEREDVNPNIRDNQGKTPLAWATQNGCDGVVKLLLGRKDVNPNIPDNRGKTPLTWAVENGHDAVVKLLLEWEDINPNIPDNCGKTVLLWATENGRDGVVKLLLGREDVNPNMPDVNGRTPLSWAAGNGCDRAVKLLLGRPDVNPNKSDHYGKTPLSQAAGNGRDEVVQLLLEQQDINPGTRDNFGQTPLLRASLWGHAGVVKLLLRREDISPNTPNTTGRTPLWVAARDGYEEIVKLLLQREDVDPNISDIDGITPLLWATKKKHKGVIKLLQAHKSTNPSPA